VSGSPSSLVLVSSSSPSSWLASPSPRTIPEGANLEGAKLAGADLTGADLTGAILKDALYDDDLHARLPDGTLPLS